MNKYLEKIAASHIIDHPIRFEDIHLNKEEYRGYRDARNSVKTRVHAGKGALAGATGMALHDLARHGVPKSKHDLIAAAARAGLGAAVGGTIGLVHGQAKTETAGYKYLDKIKAI